MKRRKTGKKNVSGNAVFMGKRKNFSKKFKKTKNNC